MNSQEFAMSKMSSHPPHATSFKYATSVLYYKWLSLETLFVGIITAEGKVKELCIHWKWNPDSLTFSY